VLELRGHVTSGIGGLSGWMTRYAGAYTAAVGVELVPGSLNVVLDAPWVMDQPDIRLEAEQIGVGAGLIAAAINDVGCWVMRTDKNNRGEGDHALEVIEVVAAVHLRSALHLGDGDPVVVEVSGA
jgi:riboflavin kinase, archaea type